MTIYIYIYIYQHEYINRLLLICAYLFKFCSLFLLDDLTCTVHYFLNNTDLATKQLHRPTKCVLYRCSKIVYQTCNKKPTQYPTRVNVFSLHFVELLNYRLPQCGNSCLLTPLGGVHLQCKVLSALKVSDKWYSTKSNSYSLPTGANKYASFS